MSFIFALPVGMLLTAGDPSTVSTPVADLWELTLTRTVLGLAGLE